MKIEISAIVCTRNQTDYLQKSLASFVAQTLPKEKFEVIVVDNGSTDSTKEVVQGFLSRCESFRYIYEPIVGLSQARNTGWRNACGEYIAYLDTDSIASPEWLERILERFKTLKPQPASVGGRIMPIWEAERPEWLTKELETYVGIIDWADKLLCLRNSPLYLAGSNVSFQKQVLEEGKGFNTSLGRKGSRLLSNEEILLQRHMEKRGQAIWYDPEIFVQHHIKAECLRKRWFYKRLFWQGISDAILDYQLSVLHGESWRYWPRMVHELYQLISASTESAKTMLARKNEHVASKCRVRHWLGRIWTDTRIKYGRLRQAIDRQEVRRIQAG